MRRSAVCRTMSKTALLRRFSPRLYLKSPSDFLTGYHPQRSQTARRDQAHSRAIKLTPLDRCAKPLDLVPD